MQGSVLLLLLLVILAGGMRQGRRMQRQWQQHLQLVQQRQLRSVQLQQQVVYQAAAAAAALLHLGCGRLLPHLLARRLRRYWHLAAMRLALVLLQQQLRPSLTSLAAGVLLWPAQLQQKLLSCHRHNSNSSMDCSLRRLLPQLLQTAALLPGCVQMYLHLQHKATPVQQQQQHQWQLRGQQRYSQHPFQQCMATHVAPAAATAPGGSSSSMWCSMGQRSNLMAAATCTEVSKICVAGMIVHWRALRHREDAAHTCGVVC
jgi:hypothetical protein